MYRWIFNSFRYLKKKLTYFFKFFEWDVYYSRDFSDDNYIKIYSETMYDDFKYFYEFFYNGNMGLMFDYLDIKLNRFEKYKNHFNRNTYFVNIFKKQIISESFLVYRWYKKSFYKNNILNKSIFGKYINLYRTSVKKEFFLFIENQTIINSRVIGFIFEDIFSSFSFTEKLFKLYNKYNNKILYNHINYKHIINNYTNFWLLSPFINLNYSDLSDHTGNLTFIYTNNLYNVYYIFKNKFHEFEENNFILNYMSIDEDLNYFVNIPEDRYSQDNTIDCFNYLKSFNFLYNFKNINKYYNIEYYKIVILIILNKLFSKNQQ